MRVIGDGLVHADSARVHAALADPAVLVRAIPGCQSVRVAGDGRYALAVTAAVASVEGTYDGEVVVTEREPDGFGVHVDASGAPGSVDASVRVRLSAADGGTLVAYEVDATVGGKLGGVGRRLLESAAQQLLTGFLVAVDRQLTASHLPALSVPRRAIAPRRTDKTVIREAVTVGAAAAVGFVVGWWARCRYVSG
ncbi:MAG: SRPBCC family protein [Streptosporangiales bacterium]